MKQPIKIIFDDDSFIEWDDSEALDYIDDYEIRLYAEWHLDMKDEDIGDFSMDDFSDDEILDELLYRYKIQKDIISVTKIKEFLNNYYL